MYILNNQKGTIFMTVIVIATLMVIIGTGLANMILQDTHMIKHLRYTTQAQMLAEAGLNDALATIANLGFSAVDNPGNFPQKNFGEGTYDVNVSKSSGRVLLTGTGTVQGATRTASLEIKDNTPTALYYMMAAGSDLRLRAFLLGLADINGNLHANNDVRLRAQALALITVDTCGASHCDGSVSDSSADPNTPQLSEGLFADIRVAGSVTSGAPLVTFPSFDYAFYEAQAQASGDYYAGDADFGSIGTTTTLNPSNGIIYVEGTARIYGTCNLYGGFVADRIRVIGRLNQYKSGTKNVVIARGDNAVGDIEIFYRLDAEEAIVYASRDFSIAAAGSWVTVTGALLASRNIRVWDFLTYITYNHRLLYPEGLLLGTSGLMVEVVNWTK